MENEMLEKQVKDLKSFIQRREKKLHKNHLAQTQLQRVLRQFDQLLELVDLMGWDYDRFSNSGKETYDKICKLLGWEVNHGQ